MFCLAYRLSSRTPNPSKLTTFEPPKPEKDVICGMALHFTFITTIDPR